MNLNEERNYQKLMDALDAMGLDGENRRIAEEYFQPGSQENTEILSRIKRQDFYKLPEEARLEFFRMCLQAAECWQDGFRQDGISDDELVQFRKKVL